MPRLFGTDGVRGVAGEELTGDLAYRLGSAAVIALTEVGEKRPHIAVGRDTRASGEFLEAALVAGICSAGGDALTLDVVTTPAVAFLTKDLGAAAGAVISASHNPADWNGIKFFAASGYKLPDDLEDEIERLALGGEAPRTSGRAIGRVLSTPGSHARYVRHLEASAPGRLDGMRIVADCANGAAFEAGPEVLRLLGAEVIPLNDTPDGWNINEDGGATAPESVARAVADAGADAGVAWDGDADRAIFADERGGVVDGDQVLAACALAMQEEGSLAGDLAVATVMSNLGLRICMRDAGITLLETKVGDRYVLEEMLRAGAVLGGEQSGHVIFLEHATTGDGLLTAVRFLALAHGRGTKVGDLASTMERFPQVLENVRVEDRPALDSAETVWEAVGRAENALGDRGRVLVRASGTEPLVRVMVEAGTLEEAARWAGEIAAAVREALG